jgi:hypothetical protein
MRNILRVSNRTPDNKDVGTGLQRLLHHIGTDTTGSRDKQLAAGCLLECRYVAPGMGGPAPITAAQNPPTSNMSGSSRW